MQDLENERDEALVSRARNGEEQAAEILLCRYSNTVRALARRFFLQNCETDDLVQEGMIGLYSAIVSYRSDTGKKFKNFASMCVYRRIIDAVKSSCRKKNEVELFDPSLSEFAEGETPEDALIDLESRKEVQTKLSKVLSDFEFRVMTLYLEGMSYALICEATGKDTKSVDNALMRAKKKLQKVFNK